MSFPTTVLNSALTTSGSASIENIDTNAIYLVYDLTGLTGSPSLVFTIARS